MPCCACNYRIVAEIVNVTSSGTTGCFKCSEYRDQSSLISEHMGFECLCIVSAQGTRVCMLFPSFRAHFSCSSLSAQPSILSSHRQEWQVRNIPEHPRTFFLRNAFWTFLPRDSLKMAWHESHVRVTTWLFVWIFLLFYFMSIRKLRNMYLGQNSATNYNDVESMHSASRRL